MSVRVDYDALGGMLKLSSWGVQLSNGFCIYINGSMHAYPIAVIQILIRTLPSPDEISKLIKSEARAIKISCGMAIGDQAKETLEETIVHDKKVDKRFDSLERALEGLSGMAIAAISRDKQQHLLLEQISARLTDLEKKATAPLPPTTSQDVDVTMGGASPPLTERRTKAGGKTCITKVAWGREEGKESQAAGDAPPLYTTRHRGPSPGLVTHSSSSPRH